MKFTKMHGAGNDYVYVNAWAESLPDDLSELAIAMSDRHTGVGGDGLVIIAPSEQADVKMRMFNADGSEAEMCGNAIRCVAKYVFDRGIVTKEELTAETGAGILTLQLFTENGHVEQVRVNMGQPILVSDKIPTTLPGDPPQNSPLEVDGHTLAVTCVSMGNPHCITFVDEVNDDNVLGLGPKVELHSAFPNRINAEFVRVINRNEVEMRVWERGSGETQACGTGACAVAVAAVLNDLTERTIVAHLPGGDLTLEWAESGDVFMTGPATHVFDGEWPV